MKLYKTSEVARIIGIHPNTVRLYEKYELIPEPIRQPNGYRVFTEFHIEQFKLARKALKVEILQNGMRKNAIKIIKASAKGNFDQAISLTLNYLKQIDQEKMNAEEAIRIAKKLLSDGKDKTGQLFLTRKETADYLQITIDTLRNWEMNGLLSVKRKQNGYRVYTDEDIKLLKIIRSLRCANYSLASILRMLKAISEFPGTNIREAIDTPNDDEDIISVCDKLLTSLRYAQENAREIRQHLEKMKKQFNNNPTL